MHVTRRFVLGGLLGGVAAPALGQARPAAAADLIAAAGLGGRVGFVVADARTGLILEARNGDVPMPPASTAKVVTSLYALEHLGAGYRFGTRLIATGPVAGGKVQGDLVLAGGGDPVLTTDNLGDMAATLRKAGVTGVTGRFLVWGGALPYLEAIDRSQPDWLGYNPAVSGLNLNFNRVNFVWKRAGGGYEVGMDARDQRFAPKVYSARVKVADRTLPVYTYRNGGRVEEWTVAKGALGKGGSRWLPVRRPELYAGDVFQTLARAQGVPLPAPEVVNRLPEGRALATHGSEELRGILRAMMKYSTNMTAEAVGMAASARRGVASHVGSGRAMSDWAKARAGATTARFADHSGLTGASRISAEDMVRVLVKLGPAAGLSGLMKEIRYKDEAGRAIAGGRARVLAKTGTLNFVSALAGYVSVAGSADLAFAIFSGDVARRDAVPDSQKERPDGGREWTRRARYLQQQLIERWAMVYGS